MKRLAVIIPGILTPKELVKKVDHMMRFVSPGTEVKAFLFSGHTRSIKVGGDVSLLAGETKAIAIEVEKQGFDALVIHGICDFGIEAARGAVDIPVIGLGSATFHLASQLADRFGVVTKSDATIPEFSRRIKLMGCFERITSLRPLNIPETDLWLRSEEITEKFIEIARYQIEHEGAQLIVAGYSAILGILPPGSKERFEQELKVPVIDGVPVALKTAEMMIDLKITQSHLTYP
ncbi:MAG: hypothetical protein KAI69_01480 [Deltaproteobacteria bacterium]|nr:hypothetical protein [Deltaproteobacteria bacterium]